MTEDGKRYGKYPTEMHGAGESKSHLRPMHHDSPKIRHLLSKSFLTVEVP